MDGPLFPQTGLCEQIKNEDKNINCLIPNLEFWENQRYQIGYYEVETRFLADVYSYFLETDYDPANPCSFVQQHQPSPAYLDLMTSYLQAQPLLRVLLLFYQYQGDRILNNYLRSGLPSAIDYLKSNREEIISHLIGDEFPVHSGPKFTLQHYGWPLQAFIDDLNHKNEEALATKYETFIHTTAEDLQTYILKAPPTTGKIISFRDVVGDLYYLNLGIGNITRLKGFTSTTIDHGSLLSTDYYFGSKLVFIIPPGAQVLPSIHVNSMDEDEVLLPHGTSVIHERSLSVNHHFDLTSKPRDIEDNQNRDIPCENSEPLLEIHVFRVLNDSWEVKAALNYNPLNYNLYSQAVDSVSAQTGVLVETIKRIAEENLFSR